MKEIKGTDWRRFLETIDFESDINNFKYDFKIMSKKYGQAFISYCKTMWEVSNQTIEEFCIMNANMPHGFFNNIINK